MTKVEYPTNENISPITNKPLSCQLLMICKFNVD